MKSSVTAVVVIAVFAAGFAMGRMTASPESASTTTQAAAAQPSPSMMAAMGAQPGEAPPPMPADRPGLTGTVAEVIQVPNYTYLRLDTSDGEQWAAVTTSPEVQVGQLVSIGQASVMSNFASKTLNRTFDTIWFGQLTGGIGAAPAPAMQGELPPGHPAPQNDLPPGHPAVGAPPAGGSLAAAAADALKGPAASSEMQVSKVYDDRLSLAGRRVRVRGMVKDAKTVAGNTVLHLSDGSGGKDLPVVTKTALGKDEVVTLEGLVAVDVDPGTGTKEQVVVQDAMVLVR